MNEGDAIVLNKQLLVNKLQEALNSDANACFIENTSVQAILDSTTTTLEFNSTVFDTNGNMADLANNRIVVPVAGVYFVSAFIRLPSLDTAEYVELDLYVGSERFIDLRYSPASNQSLFCQSWGIASLAANSVIYARASHNEGATISTGTDDYMRTKLCAFEIR